MMRFTFEEESIIRCYPGENRKGTIDKMNGAIPYLEDPMRSLVEQTKKKIEEMTNLEFDQLFNREDEHGESK